MSFEFDDVITDIEKGISGENTGIPLDFKKLSKTLSGVQKYMYTLVGGNSGTGKTAFVDLVYCLGVYDWWYKNKDTTDIKIKIIYRSMERTKKLKIAKWICLKLYIDHKIIIDIPTLFQREGKKTELNDELFELIKGYRKYFSEMLESGVVEIIDGQENPTGIFRHIQDFANKNGEWIKINEFSKRYKPNDPNLYTIIVLDHVGKCKSEVNGGKQLSTKETTDKISEYMSVVRDTYGFSPVVISQFNRSIGNIDRFKSKDVSPEPDDFKNSGCLYEDSDVCLALFNPFKLKVNDFLGYDIPKFVASSGENRFRSVSILKNSYGADDLILPLNFLGESGHFREIPNPEEFKKHSEYYKKASEYS